MKVNKFGMCERLIRKSDSAVQAMNLKSKEVTRPNSTDVNRTIRSIRPIHHEVHNFFHMACNLDSQK